MRRESLVVAIASGKGGTGKTTVATNLAVAMAEAGVAWVKPPTAEGLARAQGLLGDAVFIDQPEAGEFSTTGFDDPLEAVAMIVRRHPLRLEQIQETLAAFPATTLSRALKELEDSDRIQKITYQGITYYTCGSGRFAGSIRR